MSYDTEEQQLEKLKEWWSENGTPLIIGAVLGLAGFGGWKYWNEQKIAYQEGASDLYLAVASAAETGNAADLKASAQAVKEDFPESSYAVLAAFHTAKQAVSQGDFESAAKELSWVVENHPNNELTPMAKIRLARIYNQLNQYDDALKQLNFDETSGYFALANLVKGDALMAQEKEEQALEAYQLASEDLEVVARNPTLQLKIDMLKKAPVAAIEAPVIEPSDALDAGTNQDSTTEEGAKKTSETPASEAASEASPSEEGNQ